jgi:predicted MFS family arabinose efflux permease
MPVAMAPEARRPSQKTAVVMALAAGVSVANLYYCQPLLTQMGQPFGVGHKAGYIPDFTFVGLLLGTLLFVPLGDMFERRRLVTVMCLLVTCSAATVVMAPNFV